MCLLRQIQSLIMASIQAWPRLSRYSTTLVDFRTHVYIKSPLRTDDIFKVPPVFSLKMMEHHRFLPSSFPPTFRLGILFYARQSYKFAPKLLSLLRDKRERAEQDFLRNRGGSSRQHLSDDMTTKRDNNIRSWIFANTAFYHKISCTL